MTKGDVLTAAVGAAASIRMVTWTARRIVSRIPAHSGGGPAGVKLLRSTFCLSAVAFLNRKLVPRAADPEIAKLNRRKIMREFGLLDNALPEESERLNNDAAETPPSS